MYKKHYHDKLDELFAKGSLWKHRTLRTLFDPYSSEWNETSMEKKIAILDKILATDYPLSGWIDDYKKFYTKELTNKSHVVKSIPDALKRLSKNGSEKVKSEIQKLHLE